MQKKPLVSIIITTKNEESNIENCLKSIKYQNYKNIEIILVDNFSKDKTVKIAKKFISKIYSKGNERSDQRNYGIKKSKGEYILYLDADMIITDGLIESCVEFSLLKKINGIFIEEKILGRSFLNKIRNFERQCYNGTFIDALRFFRKKCIKNIGYFDNSINGFEDWDFSIRISDKYKSEILPKSKLKNSKWKLKKFVEEKGIKFSNLNQCIIHNETEINLTKLINKKSYYSIALNNYKKKYSKRKNILKFQLSFYNRLFKIFFTKKNFFYTLKNPVFFISSFFIKIIIGLKVLTKK